MKFSRRDALGTLGSSVTALGIGACTSPLPAAQNTSAGQTPGPSTPATLSPNESSFGRREVRFAFLGLNLFAIRNDHSAVTVAMPRSPGAKTNTHHAVLIVVGGTVAAPTGAAISFQKPQPNLSIVVFDEYRLSVGGDHPAKRKLTVHDGPAPQRQPATPTDWRSLRHLPDVSDLHPRASLKAGWDTQLSQAVVELTEGEFMAGPGSQYQQPVLGKNNVSLTTSWNVPANETLTLRFTPIKTPGAAPIDVPVTLDSTGPLVIFSTYLPTAPGGAHLHLIESLFDNVTTSAEPTLHALNGSTATLSAMGLSQAALKLNLNNLLIGVLDYVKFNDGSILCPPAAFRY